MIFARTLSARFEEALSYAVRKHGRQKRKGTDIPYVAHLLGVASIAFLYGANEDEAIAALLHDAVEDQGGRATRREIAERFGEQVAVIVDGCTDADTFPKPPWRKRKEEYIAHLATASPSMLLVSAADKLDNARSILKDLRQVGDAVWARFTGKKDGTLWYYREILKAFRAAPNSDARLGPLLDELGIVVAALETAAGAAERPARTGSRPKGSTPLRIRSAVPADAPALANLAGQLGYPATTAEILKRMEAVRVEPGLSIFVAESDTVVGWVEVGVVRSLLSASSAEIMGLVVEESRRGEGVGRQLVAAAEQWAAERGCVRIRVRTNLMREGARAFYAALGYRSTKRQEIFDKTLTTIDRRTPP